MYTATAKIIIQAPTAAVWKAITDPSLIKRYFFGTTVVSEWMKGSSIVYRGEWNGQTYEDKGTILEIEPPVRLKSTYFSPLSGQADIPENYQIVTYTLTALGHTTEVLVTQENARDQAAADHSSDNWASVLQALKSMLEE